MTRAATQLGVGLRTLELPWGPVVIADAGAGGVPVVMLHGVAGSHAYWTPAAARLAASRRAIALDLPGFGGSAPTGPGWRLEDQADAVARVLDVLGLGTVDLVGHSLGGALAAMVAARRPERVRRLVLISPIGFRPFNPRITWKYPALHQARQLLLPVARLIMRRPGGPQRLIAGVARHPQAVDPLLARELVEGSFAARRTPAAGSDVIGRDLRELTLPLALPVLVLWGEQDRALSVRVAPAVISAFADARLEVVADAGHLSMIDQPAAVDRLIESFLDAD